MYLSKKLICNYFCVCLCVLVGKSQAVPQSTMDSIYNEIKTPYKYGMVLTPPDSLKYDCPSVFRKGRFWYMTYIVHNGKGYETWIAKSKNLLKWNIQGRMLGQIRDTTQWDAVNKAGYIALQDEIWGGTYKLLRYDNKYWMTYIGGNEKGYEVGKLSIGVAFSDNKNSTKHHSWQTMSTPVLTPTDTDVRWWENKKLFKSSIIWDKQKTTGYPFVMYYNANGDSSNNTPKWRWFERIGMAGSNDMLSWHRIGKDPVVHHRIGITGDGVVQKIGNVWVMFYFGAFWENRKNETFNRFACSYDLINWTDWNGADLITSSETYDAKYAHKPFVVKWKGTVYHFYCAVDKKDVRGIAVATSNEKLKTKI